MGVRTHLPRACCSTFKLDASRYKIATPPLCWCLFLFVSALLLLLGHSISYLSLLLDGTYVTGGILLR